MYSTQSCHPLMELAPCLRCRPVQSRDLDDCPHNTRRLKVSDDSSTPLPEFEQLAPGGPHGETYPISAGARGASQSAGISSNSRRAAPGYSPPATSPQRLKRPAAQLQRRPFPRPRDSQQAKSAAHEHVSPVTAVRYPAERTMSSHAAINGGSVPRCARASSLGETSPRSRKAMSGSDEFDRRI
jgi:hypothetical protein